MRHSRGTMARPNTCFLYVFMATIRSGTASSSHAARMALLGATASHALRAAPTRGTTLVGRDWRIPQLRPKRPPPPKNGTLATLRHTLLAPVRAIRYCYERWSPTLTRTVITCSCGYCAWVAYLHDRDMKNMKKSLSNWKGVPTATVKTLKPALQQTTNAALVVGKKTRTDLVPALGQAWTAAEPFVRRAGTAVVGLMADGAAFAIDAMEDFRDAIKRKRAKRKKLLGLPFSHPARKQRRSRYDRAAEISEKITDGAEIAGAVALNTSKVATRWLGKAGKAVGKAAGGVAAMARNHTVADEGGEEVVDDEVVVEDEDAEELAEAPAEEEEVVVAPSAPEPEVAPRRRGLFPWRRRRPREDDAVAAEPEPEPDVVDEDDDRGEPEAEAEADEEEVVEEEESEEEAGEIYSSDSSASLATPFLAQIRVLKEIIQLTTAPPSPAPPPDAPTLAERASSEPAEVYFV
ncbi:unnamed protein product [Pelagomonas calceolata]|uniref:Senescence domain-containing protein n=1 Tax=Pelagomonas calceolata TaxID=35677 RepID=A0A8J2SZS0_9STRA|nr:unnamed protein product [Pelagomonas calceolata]|mmetsp:Transcript_11339/g.33590  ORF Transcript_11339/g.33590 Transcript_11339/m.33590 type:complete len:463 (+) Transcript_11339:32-1420(+)